MPRLTKNSTSRPPKYNVNYLHVQNNPMFSSSAPPPGFYHDPSEYRRHNIIQTLINPDKNPNKTATIVKDQSKEESSTNPMKLLNQRMKYIPEMNKKIIPKSNISLAKMAEVRSNSLLEKRKKRLMKSQEKNLNIEQEMAPIIAQMLIDDRVDILKEKLKRIGLTSDHLTKLRVSDYEVSLLAAPFTQLLKEFQQENRPLFGLVHRLGLSMAQLAEISIRRSDVDGQLLPQEPISMQVESSNAMTYTDRISLLERKARELQVFKEKEFRKNLENIEDEMVASTYAKKKGKKQNENRGMELTGKNAKKITSDMVLTSALRKPAPVPEVAKLNSKDDVTPLVRYLRVFPPPVTPEARVAFISQLEQRIEDARADEEGLAGLTGIPANRPYHKLCEIDLARTLTDPAIKSNSKLSMLFMKLSALGVTRARLREANIRPSELIEMLTEFRRLAQYGASCSQVRACLLRCEDLSQAGVPCFELRRGLRIPHLEAFGLTLERLEQLGITAKDLRGLGIRGVQGERSPRASLPVTVPVNVLKAGLPMPQPPNEPSGNKMFAKPLGNHAFNRAARRSATANAT